MSTSTRDTVMTPWRVQVLTLAANGYTNAQIGKQFGHTGNAINLHFQTIYKALGAKSRAHAVALGIRDGYINPDQVQPAPTAGRDAA